MFESESIRLREILLGQGGVSPLLNLGSSDARFRAETKPHIEAELFAPLRAAGVALVHSDRKTGEGIDVSGDILDPRVRARLAAMGFRALLLSNVLEHVADRAAVAAACEEIVGPGGLILATVPSSYPYHADPVDTGYRPSPAELAACFAGSEPLLLETVEDGTYADRIRRGGQTIAGELIRTVFWTLLFPLRPKSALGRLDRWRWYGKPYRVSIALVRVRAPSSAS